MKRKIKTQQNGPFKATTQFMGVERDIGPYMAPTVRRRIGRSYYEEFDINVPDKVIRKAFPEEWRAMLAARKFARKELPIWRRNAAGTLEF